MATLLELALVDETGRLLDRDEAETLRPALPPAILDRLVEIDGEPALLLAKGRSEQHRDVVLTQGDVREFQLAKGAVAAGVQVLLEHCELKPEDLDLVCLAGGFGTYLRADSALRVGMLPAVSANSIQSVGNSALAGVRLFLLNADMRRLAREIAAETEYLELSGRLDFQMAFADAMLFPTQA
jgi:uncharacterized 2Fe-2S/4Fe-4S cluster protein (DUF4445 family)